MAYVVCYEVLLRAGGHVAVLVLHVSVRVMAEVDYNELLCCEVLLRAGGHVAVGAPVAVREMVEVDYGELQGLVAAPGDDDLLREAAACSCRGLRTASTESVRLAAEQQLHVQGRQLFRWGPRLSYPGWAMCPEVGLPARVLQQQARGRGQRSGQSSTLALLNRGAGPGKPEQGPGV